MTNNKTVQSKPGQPGKSNTLRTDLLVNQKPATAGSSQASRGFLPFALLLLVGIILVIMILPLAATQLSPELNILIQLYFALSIFMFVRGMVGGGLLSYILSGILIYIFVIRLFPIFAAGYMLYLVASLGLTSILFFALQPSGGGGMAAKARGGM